MTTRYRTRTKNDHWERVSKVYGTGPGVHSSCLYPVLRDIEEMEDVVTPDFHKRIAAGEIINNDCVYEVYHASSGSGYYSLGNSVTVYYSILEGSVTYYQAVYHWPSKLKLRNPAVDTIELNVNKAKAQAWANIDKTPYAFAEDAFELRETIKFLKSPASSLLRLAKSFRRASRKATKRFKDANDIVKAIDDVWLQYRFAASPLVRSSMDAIEAYNDKTHKRPSRRTARGFDSGENKLTETLSNVKGGATDIIEKVSYYDGHASAGILYEVSNPVDDLNFRLGLRVKDIPETLWQIVPLSFMVDRVFNISEVIRGITNLLDPRVKILTAWTTEKHIEGRTLEWKDQIVPGYQTEVIGDIVTEERFYYERHPWTPTSSDIFLGGFTPRELIKDATNIADLFALTHTILGGR